MCGIIGAITTQYVNQDIYDGLTIIQHRGQDAAGMITYDDTTRHVHIRKSNGLLRDVIRESHMLRLTGKMGLGHVRYPTAGTFSSAESQPFYVNSPYGLSLVHNGNLVNTESLAHDLMKTDLRHLNTYSDSEVLLNIFAHKLAQVGEEQLTPTALFKAVKKVYERVQGAYSALVMINGYGIVGFRDAFGIRPLVYGKRRTEQSTDYMFSSETIALDALRFEPLGDVKPGEAVYIDLEGRVHRQICAHQAQLSPCIFEFIYLARPDSVIDHISVYRSRLNMGIRLANKILRTHPNHPIDVVIPIPDTSRTCALPLAQRLDVNYSEGFVKNRYIGRTFIMPGQAIRRSSVRMKLNAIKDEFLNKNVLLVDDSIVRGTTSKEIIQMARDAGAKQVFFASSAPEVRFPNVYGIDMPVAEELIAHNKTADEVAAIIGADWLIYQDLPDVYAAINEAVKPGYEKIQRFEDSIFTGNYMAGTLDSAYFRQLKTRRGEAAKTSQV
ncbi:MAG TPA: amidophosphoribosyltransferase [Coxiellaceae bacterium]|nr:amidophosphoribosyltransferase [Coxiellaceae bacterium]